MASQTSGSRGAVGPLGFQMFASNVLNELDIYLKII